MANIYTNQGSYYVNNNEYPSNTTTTTINVLNPLIEKETTTSTRADGRPYVTNTFTFTNLNATPFSFTGNTSEPAFSDTYDLVNTVLGLVPISYATYTPNSLKINGNPIAPTSTANGTLTLSSLPALPPSLTPANLGTMTLSFEVDF